MEEYEDFKDLKYKLFDEKALRRLKRLDNAFESKTNKSDYNI
jgi:hypothetical protein